MTNANPQMTTNPSGTFRYFCPGDAHLAYQTMFTRKGRRNMMNHKPYRTPVQAAKARQVAGKTKGGFWISSGPVSYHN